VAPDPAYFDEHLPSDPVQLVVVGLHAAADHHPERTIVARLRSEVDWGFFWRLVR
jgi:hypothetical protein